MQVENGWYPMQWPCGPLARHLAEKSRPGSRELNETQMSWLEPASLDLLRGTPVNCLVVPWAIGGPEDQQQQRKLQPLLSEGRRREVNFVGRVAVAADPKVAASSAQHAGLAALVMEVPPRERLSLPVIQWNERAKIRWDAPSLVLAITDAVWPGIRGNGGSGGRAIQAGPTGMPWLDSNTWLIQLIRKWSQSKSVWMSFEPPEEAAALPVESYLLALADTECCGARWPISLDGAFHMALARKEATAVESWRQMTAALDFFRSRSIWAGFRPMAALGVVSTSSAPDALMSGEILNLLQRRQVPFLILGNAPWTAAELLGIEALLSADPEPPPANLRGALFAFAERGGLLVVSSGWAKLARSSGSSSCLDGRYQVCCRGRGRVAIAQEEWQDPYLLAEEVHLLMSRRNDLFRLGNGTSMNAYCSSSADGKRTVVHLVNFDRRSRRSPVSLWVKRPFRLARFWKLAADEPVALSEVPEREGKELPLPPFATYAAVELES